MPHPLLEALVGYGLLEEDRGAGAAEAHKRERWRGREDTQCVGEGEPTLKYLLHNVKLTLYNISEYELVSVGGQPTTTAIYPTFSH